MCCPYVTFVCLSGQILLPRYLMNGLNSLDETYREYSLTSPGLLNVQMTWLYSGSQRSRSHQGVVLWTPHLELLKQYRWNLQRLDFEGQRWRSQQAIEVANVNTDVHILVYYLFAIIASVTALCRPGARLTKYLRTNLW